jgi:predicted ATPase/DNA-binding SARP family transcriptional activator
VPIGRLTEELGSERGDDDPRADRGGASALKVQVSRLRSALGGAATITGSSVGYRLEVSPAAIDLVRFEQAIEDARRNRHGRSRRAAAAARAALELWRGAPFGGTGEPPIGSALASQSTRLVELRLEALELRLEADGELGGSTDLIAELEALVAEHPYRERLWRELMLALYHADRQADALAAYHRARRALDEELGVDPGEELVTLEAAILRHDVPARLPPQRRHNLPSPVTSFIGRETELANANALLAHARLVTLTGIGGVGKTRLGLELARSAIDDVADGVWFVDLARLADPQLVATEVAAALGVPEDAARTAVARLVDHLGQREALLVLDNCEHLAEACASLARTLLERSPATRILATSRVPLGVAGEVALPVAPMTLATDAVTLFLERARAASPGLAVDAGDAGVVGRICEVLEGLPLAIELAAARARSLALPDIADRLRDRFRFLVSWRRLTDARHGTLREAMDWSYELLAPAERLVLERLSVFAGAFDLDAATAVAAIGSEEAALDAIERLIDASLVVTIRSPGSPMRYRLLETVRQHAAERLAEAGDEAATQERHAHFYAAFAAAADLGHRDGDDERRALERLAGGRDNIRAALGWLHDQGEWVELLRVGEALWRYWWVRGEALEGRGWLERAIVLPDRLGSTPPDADTSRLLGDALRGLAALAWSQGDFDAARAAALRAEALFDKLHDALGQGRCWNTIGVIEHGRRDFPGARIAFERSIALLRAADVEPVRRAQLLATSMDNLGSVFYETGDTARAIDLYQQARDLHATEGQGAETALMDLHLGRAAVTAGNLANASGLLASATRHYSALGFLQYTTECLEGIGSLAIARGDHRMAAIEFGAASRLREQTRTPYWGRMEAEALRHSEDARAALGDAAFEAAWEIGRADPQGAVARGLDWVTAGL